MLYSRGNPVCRNADEIYNKVFSSNGLYAANDNYLLRAPVEDDREAYLEIYRQKPEFDDFFDDPTFNLPNGFWHEFVNSSDTMNVVIVRKSDNMFCGFCSLEKFTTLFEPSISIEIIPELQHKGIGSSVLPMLLKRFYDVTGINSFVSQVYCDDQASLKLMRKIGCVPAGILPFPNVPDEILGIFDRKTTPQPEYIQDLACEFNTTPRKLRSHVLVYRFLVKE